MTRSRPQGGTVQTAIGGAGQGTTATGTVRYEPIDDGINRDGTLIPADSVIALPPGVAALRFTFRLTASLRDRTMGLWYLELQ